MIVDGPSVATVPRTQPLALPVVLLAGNPNTGKTTLFNALSGESARVGNYPGITVERRAALIHVHLGSESKSKAELVDLPGAYSLSARSPEERITLEAMLGIGGHTEPQLVVVVVDAGQLARNLYLLLQIMELGVPTVVAINMIDEVKPPPDVAALSKRLGVPCVATSARKLHGITELRAAIDQALQRHRAPVVEPAYPNALLTQIDVIARTLPAEWHLREEQKRPVALWAIMSLGDDELRDIPNELRAGCLRLRMEEAEQDLDMEIVRSRYQWIEERLGQSRSKPPHPPKRPISDRIDRIMLHPVLGFLVFALITVSLFQLLFVGADPLIHAVETAVSWLQRIIVHYASPGWPRDLVVKGIIGGVGNVVVFLPQIALLFAMIGLLEDSGYMSRVAFLIDRVMRLLGLHGRAFVPMISGFACAVPAIMATRTLERQRDRLLTMLVVPLMTCSARLPVYTLIIGALFPPTRIGGWLPIQGTLMVGMYAFSIIATLLAAWVLGRTVVKAHRVPLILELPPYRMPHLRSIFRMVVSRSNAFLREAGSIILVCTVALWALLAFPRDQTPAPEPSKPVLSSSGDHVSPPPAMHSVAHAQPANKPSSRIERSPGAKLGRALEPIIKPLGFDWRIGVGLVGSFAAREVFVSTMALVYGISDDEEAEAPLRERMRTERRADGSRPYTPLVGASLLAFFAIACQCSSTLAVIRRETRSWRWPLFLFAYTGVLAWLTSFAIYQGGRLLGFS
jgi:ferrous iron transport protein B